MSSSTHLELVDVTHPFLGVEAHAPRTLIVEDDRASRVPADAWAVSFSTDEVVALVGPRPWILSALARARRALVTYCIGEHENALHVGQPEGGCPACDREQAEAATEDEAYAENARRDAEQARDGETGEPPEITPAGESSEARAG